MGILLDLYDGTLYEGGTTSVDVPGFFQVALGGLGYLIDWTTDQILRYQYRFKHATAPVQRAQSDTSESPGEQTLSPEGLWRRAMESWHHGAGQSMFDRKDLSDPYRFLTSKGIDVWTQWQFTLLNATTQVKDDSNTNLKLVPAGSRLYLAYGQKLAYTTAADLTSWTDVTGTDASTLKDVTSDGFHVYGAWNDGIGRTDTSTGAITDAWNALVASKIAYVKDRLMAAGSGSDKHKLYNVTASGAAPSAHFTPLNTDTTWVGFAEGEACIYAACYSGDKSLVYRIPLKTDGTSLDAPIVCGKLPDGEVVRSIVSYLGFVVLGTDKGWRFAEPVNDQGDLAIGALVTTTSPVYCFEGQDRFLWYGLGNYDGTSTGLGRMDLTTLNTGNVPAYASDLMATDQGDVLSVCTFDDIRIFAVSGQGIYAEDTDNLVASGTIDSGDITYGLPDQKVAVGLDVRHESISSTSGSHTAWLSVDGDAYTSIGTHAASHPDGETFTTSQLTGERVSVRHVLTRGSTTTTAPVIKRVTLKCQPRVNTVLKIQVPIILADYLDVEGATVPRDPYAEYEAILALRSTQQVVQYQEFNASYSVIVEDVLLFPEDFGDGGSLGNATCILQLKTLDV